MISLVIDTCTNNVIIGLLKDKEIIDQKIYFDPAKNIPCKIKKEDLISEDNEFRNENSEKTPITFSFNGN